MNLDRIAFVDCETTSLDPDTGQIWEVAVAVGDADWQAWHLPVDLTHADARSLDIGRFHQRHGRNHRGEEIDIVGDLADWSFGFAKITWGLHLCGAVVSFDEERLRRLLRRWGACPGWHYHMIDVEAVAVGALAARGEKVELPWNSTELSHALDVDPDEFERHTAAGDVEWARALYLAATEPAPKPAPAKRARKAAT